MAQPKPSTFVTVQQAVIHAMFVKHRSMSLVARVMGLSMIRVREALVQHERDIMRDQGIQPPPLREMLKGDVTTRFGVSREESGGRPSKHVQHHLKESDGAAVTAEPVRQQISATVPRSGVRCFVITSVETEAQVHAGFWRNLKAYAAARQAELVVARIGSVSPKNAQRGDHFDYLTTNSITIEGLLDVALDEKVPARLARPLEAVRHRSSAMWTIIVHPAVQFETLPRIRADGYKAQITTGAMSLPSANRPPWRRELGAVVVEVTHGGTAHCRHLLAEIDGDGSFQDLDIQVSAGVVRRGARVEALTFGDIHHTHIDPGIAQATWGLEAHDSSAPSLVDRLRPRNMVFHDVCDFDARNQHDRRDHLRRFAQMAAGGGDVAAELTASAAFLHATRRDWARSVVVNSNHDDALVRWLREVDFREDPQNALFFLESSLLLHRRLAAGEGTDGFFEQSLRSLSTDGLVGVRFLRLGESLRIGGVEAAIHGHAGADGKQGDVRFFERLGIRATLGHTHRPMTRDGIYCSGVCQTELAYAAGAITGWGVGHVVTYPTGARQHLIFIDGAFHG